jgi:glycogen debranching enzyme
VTSLQIDDLVAPATRFATAVLRDNRRRGRSGEPPADFDFTCPSPSTYPFQWCWDSCFHAIALTHVDPQRAKRELSTLLKSADPSGFIPHMLLWQDELRAQAVTDFRIALWTDWRTSTIAPPVLARSVYRVYKATGDDEWLQSMLPAVVRYFTWLADRRSGPDGLLVIFQPDESGLDSSPKYDSALALDPTSAEVGKEWHVAMRRLIGDPAIRRDPHAGAAGRRFVWVDVLINTIYADGLSCLAKLLGPGGRIFARRAAAVLNALITHCWDDRRGVFHDIDVLTGRQIDVVTSSSLFPLVLEDLPAPIARRLINDHLLNESEFWLRYPVPSVAATEPSFDPDFTTKAIFRGSTWVNLNWYLHAGLRAHGRHDVAAELALRTLEMVARSGMRECYGPHDAAGHGAERFGWSSLVLDLIAAAREP